MGEFVARGGSILEGTITLSEKWRLRVKNVDLEASPMLTRDRLTQADTRPILFVCHSLGGIILKQALCIANEQLHRYELLVNLVSGIIFLSTPHPTLNNRYNGLTVLRLATKTKVK